MSLSCKTTVKEKKNSAVISINLRTPKESSLWLVSFAEANVSSIHSLKVGLLCHSYLPVWFSLPKKCSLFLFNTSNIFKTWPNARSISTKLVAILLSTAFCRRLTTMLQYVASCWMMLYQIWKRPDFSCNIFYIDVVLVWPRWYNFVGLEYAC